jgi:cathepsin L
MNAFVFLTVTAFLLLQAEARFPRVHNARRGTNDLEHVMERAFADWEDFKMLYGKSFDDEAMENEHMLAFISSQQRVARHNALYEAGEVSFQQGINHLSDLPRSEYQRLNGFRMDLRRHQSNVSTFLPPLNMGALPATVDWRTKGYVTPVKDQKQCGSCWAFSATGSLEGQHFRQTGKLVSLSEQNLVDCSHPEGNDGCNGGLMDDAFKYIAINKGIDTEASYPYLAVTEPTCHFKRSTVGAQDVSYVDIATGNEQALLAAVATQGPISVAIDASNESFQQYQSGVYYEQECSSTQLDHGVLVVGYGTDAEGGDYWIVKNSWNADWGMNGYIWMARNKNNNCGIATAASYPLVKEC